MNTINFIFAAALLALFAGSTQAQEKPTPFPTVEGVEVTPFPTEETPIPTKKPPTPLTMTPTFPKTMKPTPSLSFSYSSSLSYGGVEYYEFGSKMAKMAKKSKGGKRN